MRLPKPPIQNSIADQHRSITDIISLLEQMFNQGTKHAFFTQAQIDTFTDKSYLGTIVFNSTTNESNISYLDAGVVKWRAV